MHEEILQDSTEGCVDCQAIALEALAEYLEIVGDIYGSDDLISIEDMEKVKMPKNENMNEFGKMLTEMVNIPDDQLDNLIEGILDMMKSKEVKNE
jgi:hypothetical protein